jgi:hypothetical protein
VVVASLPGSPSALTRLADQGPIVWIGVRSYGIYLWHWPVILLVTAVLPATAPGSDPTLLTVALSLGLTFGLAEASFRWIETPIRRDGFGPTWAVLRRHSVATAGLLALVAVAAVAVVSAPTKTEAQLAVERGEAAIAAQAADGGGGATTTTGDDAPAWPTALAVPPGELIAGFGDSVLSGAAPAVYERFPGILLDATPIRQWRDAPAAIQPLLDAGRMRPVVVLSFGTNAGLESAESEQGLRRVLDALGPGRRIVLVNIVGVSDWVPATNAKLAAISAEHPNTAVMDWHATVAANPSLLHDDRTHPNFDGIQVYADQLAETLDRLGPR